MRIYRWTRLKCGITGLLSLRRIESKANLCASFVTLGATKVYKWYELACQEIWSTHVYQFLLPDILYIVKLYVHWQSCAQVVNDDKDVC